jgi:hypothetical protein
MNNNALGTLGTIRTLVAFTKVLPGGEWLGEYAPIVIFTPTFGTSTIHDDTILYGWDEDDELECWQEGTQVRVSWNSEKGFHTVEPYK